MKKISSIFFLFLIISAVSGQSSDWPMWRYDSKRSASTPEQLPEQLNLQWQVKYSPRIPVWDDPLNQNLMKFDRLFEPVVADNKLFIGFNDQDKVVALDLNSGNEIWHFYADGPVRLPLAINNGKIYFTGDDGFIYCLNSTSGSLVWKRLLAPAENKLLGNKRLISMWPARGGVVIKDDIVYTAASIFPLMGTFIYALDATTGDIIWKNEGTGSNYILQPHRSPAFADVAPQGAFTISGDKLLVAGGRSVPAAFNLKTGDEIYYHLAASGKTGGAFTCASDKVFFNHHRERMTNMYDSKTGKKLVSKAGEYPVVDGDSFYFSGKNIVAAKLGIENKLDTLWMKDISASNDLIKAGNCLFAADSIGITALKLHPDKEAEVIWRYRSDKNIERLIAANGKLVAVADDGTIMTFGESSVAEVKEYDRSVNNIISNIEVSDGYCLVFGGEDISLLENLVYNTSFDIVVYEKESQRVQALREYFDSAGVTSDRISFQHFHHTFPKLPKYFSSHTIVNDLVYIGGGRKDFIEKLYETTRPYGGKILIPLKREKRKRLMASLNTMHLPGSSIRAEKGLSIITRTGPLQGASPWTHNYGDIANTVKSDDQLVKAPLGILWFGGNSNMDVLPRHGHGPGEQVIDGRLIILGMNSISARDVYTGRVLWRHKSENLLDDNWLVYYNETYDEEHPLDPKYNQVHLPGSNSRGTNYIATKEFVYLIEGNKCTLIDINNGEVAREFMTGDNDTQKLGYIGVYKDFLILGNNFAEFQGTENDTILAKRMNFSDFDLSASKELTVLNRFSGERLWSIKANHGFIHNSVIAGDDMLFCLDKLPQYLETKLKRRGEPIPQGSRLLYLDAKTGQIIQEETEDVFGTWLGYSAEHKLLLQATRPSRDMLHGEMGNRMITYDIRTKDKIWDRAMRYANPPIIHNDKIYTNGEGFHLLTGEQLTEKDPITGEDLKWSYKREYGCGIVAASEHLLTFRSASAGFINLDTFEGTGSLGGWKSSCSTNLIAADGVLNSPDYTRTCQCAYQNQTSLALIHMPWMAYWTNSNYTWNGKPVQQLGLNLNAPGDRSADNKVLWLEFPFVAGTPPGIRVKIDTSGYKEIRKEPISISSENTPWVSSSALIGINSIEITLAEDNLIPESTYRVKLYFAELEDKKEDERSFDIVVQGEKLIEKFDIVKEAGKIDKEIVKTFARIKAGEKLKIDLIPIKGNTLISGVELIQERLVE
ncbi:MAG: PQQ-binding-like beta-propeller repeat protein [Bacteroidetes bacterium]|jgi:outer membrane protein assembly factor BamB|nr:PQQ-binding-like beta-propeller repeat protein [Bacteroidota bacterium]MBT3747639.1 PQQ-binding-like beta-propeller repeat protein [Bacteroidota bacterium]MBT4402067.1 PQQ-binding-like beta-propeller repeat protein [Bacteroidota bacterium]MBT4409420.1 PQQ-binding-like beta-propeller repeat protein [Bacteroidota bacterium]MBT7462550.1 PQQ-binding-like beta-propeller repeat protein [Bacteroidota bacterium]